MEKEIRQSIEQFVRAGDEQDEALLLSATHPDFRVVAPNYPTPGNTAVLGREQFGALLSGKKIGGETRQIDIVDFQRVGEDGAVVRARLTSPTLVFENAFTVIKSDGQWKLVQDLASAKPRS